MMTVAPRHVVVTAWGALGRFAPAIGMRLSQGWMNAPIRNLGGQPRGFSPGKIPLGSVTRYGPI